MRYGELKSVFDTVEQTFWELEIDYYMIGALARQVWYEKVNLKFKITKDVDYAALIGSHEEYQKVKDHLIEKEGYLESKKNAFVLITPEGIQVDILPLVKLSQMSALKFQGWE